MISRYFLSASNSLLRISKVSHMATSGNPDRSEARRPVGVLTSTAMMVSRARWFRFLRKVFQYQNGLRSDLRSNPFNSLPWLLLEFIVLVSQIAFVTATMVVSQEETPLWPLRIWIGSYNTANLFSIPLLYWRYRCSKSSRSHPSLAPDLEQQRSLEESRSSHLMNKAGSHLELFYALWFVMGNVWIFDSRLGSFDRAPKLRFLGIALLSWNAIIYSFPFFCSCCSAVLCLFSAILQGSASAWLPAAEEPPKIRYLAFPSGDSARLRMKLSFRIVVFALQNMKIKKRLGSFHASIYFIKDVLING